MIKILFYKNHLRLIGGIERIWINKMNYLSEDSNYKIFIVTNAQEHIEPVFPLSQKVEHIDLNICMHKAYYYPAIVRPFIKAWKYILHYIRLQKTITRINPDFIIIDSTYDPVLFWVSTNAKIIAESHTAKSFIHFERDKSQQMFKDYENKSDIVVALTQGDAKEWMNAKQVEIIPNFIEAKPTPIIPQQEHKRVISSGRLVYQKRQDELIKAWAKVATNHPDWKLDIYGKGEKYETLQELIVTLNMQNHIRIIPPTPDFDKELINCDFFVMSSLYEGFSLVIAEAMMAGLPCVSYDCPYGPSDLIDHGKTGLLVPNGQTDELANAINWIIEHPEQRKVMGQEAYQSIQKYTPEYVIPKWKELFEKNIFTYQTE